MSQANQGAQRRSRKTLVIAGLTVCVAIFLAVILLHVVHSPSAVAVDPVKTQQRSDLSHRVEHVRAEMRSNAAVQKAGPPDPIAEKISAASASSAADAAAALAAASQTTH